MSVTSARVTRLRERLQRDGLDALLVSGPENRRYVSGFTGTAGSVLVTAADRQWFITDFRYVDQAKAQCQGFEIVNQGSSYTDALANLLRSAGVKRLGFEQDILTYGEVERLRVLERDADVELVPTSGMVEALRQVKDEEEIRCIERAAEIADAAFKHMLEWLRPGVTEAEVALELETTMRRLGASGAAFTTIIASGVRSSLPHGVASDKVIERGDLVTLDFGAVYEGYCSDLTRTVVVGPPSERQLEIYQIVLEAERAALAAARPGMTGKALDAVARDLIASRGYGEAFGHSLGHGIGLAIHEDPRVSRLGEEVLQPGMVVTIEPGIYLSGWGGVRIEDDIVLTEQGARILTHSPKDELIQVG
ncbi:MAG: aminopeptidase P family protein [Thermoflavifilum sp.]|nr:aminopeptidase P family protein [Thermoflavifilum sp.]MCL6513999.1 Xaa-Pro peptidase family protein [Alicyclobacillus sp.]